MKTVSMLDFRRDAASVVRRAMRGERMLLTRRGLPVLRIEPYLPDEPQAAGDPFFALAELADKSAPSLTNEQIDEELYGH